MVYSHRNLAYDLTLFEEPYEDEYQIHGRLKNKKVERSAPQDNEELTIEENKKERAEKKQKVRKAKRKKGDVMKIAMASIFGIALVVVVASIIQGQVQLTELNQKISNAKDDLLEKQSVYTQLEMKVDSGISTSVVEEYAQEKLNMSKASNSQKEFIDLSKGDKAEVTLSSHNNVFESISQAFSDLWS